MTNISKYILTNYRKYALCLVKKSDHEVVICVKVLKFSGIIAKELGRDTVN